MRGGNEPPGLRPQQQAVRARWQGAGSTRAKWARHWVAPALALALLFISWPGAAQEDPFAAVKAAIRANQLEPARQALTSFLAQYPQSLEGRFLLAEVETRSGNYDAAIRIYRQMLAEQPNLVRVQLELGRALFLAKQDRESRKTFQSLLAQELPPQVQINVRQYLSALDARKQYFFNVSVGGIYDTDVNQAPQLNVIRLFGLPFQLSKSAQAQAEPGVVISGIGEYWTPITTQSRWRFGTSFYRNEYPTGDFDDMQVRVYTGPQYTTQSWQVAALGVFAKRMYANDPYNSGYGPRLEAAYRPSDSILLENVAEYLSVDYHAQPFLNGFDLSDNLFTTYLINPTTFVRLITGVARERTQNEGFSYDALRLGLGFHQEFKNGITIDFQPEVFVTSYDAPNPIFLARRRDQIVTVRAIAANNRWEFGGAIPYISYTYTNDMSNLEFYSYQRHQVQVGLTFHF